MRETEQLVLSLIVIYFACCGFVPVCSVLCFDILIESHTVIVCITSGTKIELSSRSFLLHISHFLYVTQLS